LITPELLVPVLISLLLLSGCCLYRSKIHQEDLIDVLLKEEKNIMKEI
jgi:hypothetical protein